MMGLSSMDNRKEQQLKYAMNFYVSPTFGQWHEWFAWHPVKIVTFKENYRSDSIVWDGFYIKHYRWAWLITVVRRRVTDRLDGPGRESAGIKKYYEYTTIMDILTHGY